MYRAAKDRALKKGMPFDLEPGDIILPAVCPVFNTPFVRHSKYAASLDKIDPSLGYVKGNVQVLSKKANLMKQNATQNELELFASWILNQKR